MFTLVMMTALSGSPDAVQFGGRSYGCDGGRGGLLAGLFNRGGGGWWRHADCCGPTVWAAPCGGCATAAPCASGCGGCATAAPCASGCGGCGGGSWVAPVTPAPAPMGTTPGVTPAPQVMPAPAGATPGVTPAPAAGKPANPPGGTF